VRRRHEERHPRPSQTVEQCDARLEQQLIAHAKPVMQCVPGLKDRPNQLAASVSLAYNIGTAAFCRSTVARRFNAASGGRAAMRSSHGAMPGAGRFAVS
jgi:lysozyme